MTNKELLVKTLNFIKDNPHRWEQCDFPRDRTVLDADPNTQTCFGGWLLYFLGTRSVHFMDIPFELWKYLSNRNAFCCDTTLPELESIVNSYPD